VTAALIINLVTLCVNIPQFLAWYPWLFYLTITVDVICFIILTVDLVHRYNSSVRNAQITEGPKIKKIFFFDGFLTLLILLSALLQAVELVDKLTATKKGSMEHLISKQYFFKFIRRTVRAPRPGLMIWIWRNCTPVRLPQSSYNLIVKKAGQQIWGVTLFLLFFLVFYGILGVQLFGNFEYHCVRRKSNRGESEDQYFNRLLDGDVSTTRSSNAVLVYSKWFESRVGIKFARLIILACFFRSHKSKNRHHDKHRTNHAKSNRQSLNFLFQCFFNLNYYRIQDPCSQK
jgi:hypothetical protein